MLSGAGRGRILNAGLLCNLTLPAPSCTQRNLAPKLVYLKLTVMEGGPAKYYYLFVDKFGNSNINLWIINATNVLLGTTTCTEDLFHSYWRSNSYINFWKNCPLFSCI